MGVCYCLREQVKAAVDVKDSARANAQIDRISEDVSRVIDQSLCRRTFYPRLETQSFDWPHSDRPTPWRLWLGGKSELISLISVTSGGVTIPLSSVLLYPTYGPPYTRLELDRATVAGFQTAGSPQNAITIAGLFGYRNDERTVTTLAEDLDTSETDIDVSSTATVGPGALIRVDDERMLVTGSKALDTGINLAAGVTNQMNATAIPLSTATGAPQPNEIIAVDGERMLVLDQVGTTLYVRRAYDGTPAAAHLINADVYAYRTLTVDRGAVGTAAAAHTSGASVRRWLPPPSVEGLAIAETLNQLAQEGSAYARVIGSGDNQMEARGAGLATKRADVRKAYGRKVRMGAV